MEIKTMRRCRTEGCIFPATQGSALCATHEERLQALKAEAGRVAIPVEFKIRLWRYACKWHVEAEVKDSMHPATPAIKLMKDNERTGPLLKEVEEFVRKYGGG